MASPSSPKREAAPLKNSAVVYLKPHACNPKVRDVVAEKLRSVPSLAVTAQLDLTGRRIDEGDVIDRHYHTIAANAKKKPYEIENFPVREFEAFFSSERWTWVVSGNKAVSLEEARKRFDWSTEELDAAWQEADTNGKVTKLRNGLYCGLVQDGKSSSKSPPLYVINGFYPAMRERYVSPEAIVHCVTVEWDPSRLSWADFRSKIIGYDGTGQALPAEGSIRREVFDRYEELGLAEAPNHARGLDVVHASASPLEGLSEKVNWMRKKILDDRYGRALVAQGLTERLLREEFFLDPTLRLPGGGGSKGSVFDAVRDMDATPCLDMLVAIYDAELEDARNESELCADCTCSVM